MLNKNSKNVLTFNRDKQFVYSEVIANKFQCSYTLRKKHIHSLAIQTTNTKKLLFVIKIIKLICTNNCKILVEKNNILEYIRNNNYCFVITYF